MGQGCKSFPFPDPQQPFHFLLPFPGDPLVTCGVAQGDAVAALFHAVHRLLAGVVQALFQGILGHGGDDDHGDVLPVTGLHDLQQVDVKEVAGRFPAEVVENQKVVAADIV